MNQTETIRTLRIFVLFLTLTALSRSGASGIPNFFATDTPTATNTFRPGPTMTPSPTATATKTPSPTSTPLPTGINVEQQADSTIFSPITITNIS